MQEQEEKNEGPSGESSTRPMIVLGLFILIALIWMLVTKVSYITVERSHSGHTFYNSYLLWKSGDDDAAQKFGMVSDLSEMCLEHPGLYGMCLRMGIGVIKRNPYIELSSGVKSNR